MQLKKYASIPQPKHAFTGAAVKQVVELGCSKAVAVFALEACNGDVTKACEMLVEYGLVKQ